jgi:peptidoglycan/LPS O-acetylase OafA/YrhL
MRAHLPALDGLRGLAILLVVLTHMRMPPMDGPLDQFVGFWLNAGWLGVDLFFVLSGFLITGILLDAKGGPGYFRRFYMRRVLRIFPLYYLALAVFFFVVPHLTDLGGALRSDGTAGREGWFWLYLSNVDITLHGWPETVLAPGVFRTDALVLTWSLAIEEQFYLVWPLVVLACSRRRLLGVCLALVVVAPIFRRILLVAGLGPAGPYILMPSRMDGFAVGAGLALLARQPEGLTPLVRWARFVAPVAAIALVGIALERGSASYSTWLMETVGFSVSAFGFGALLVLSQTSARVSAVFRWPLLRAYGRYSYAIYLLHVPLARLLLPWLFPPNTPPIIFGSRLPVQLLADGVMFPAVLVVGWLSWYLFERHFLALKRFFPYGTSDRVPARTVHHKAEPGFALRPILQTPELAE